MSGGKAVCDEIEGDLMNKLFDFPNISVDSLKKLIEDKIFESRDLEYKNYNFTNGKMDEKQKQDLMKEVSAFANTNGGYIVIGIGEDENRHPSELSGTGMSVSLFDEWLSSFRQVLLSKIRPHLHGFECKAIEVSSDNIAIVIKVSKSFNRPHSFYNGNKDEFYIRYANGVGFMDINDLRNQFLNTETFKHHIAEFRRDRISAILNDEIIGNFNKGAKLLIHIIPLWSFESGNSIDLTNEYQLREYFPLVSSKFINNWRYNTDGFCLYNSNNELINTSTQIFRNGIIEAIEVRLMNYEYKYEKRIYNWNEMEKLLYETIEKYASSMSKLGIPKPWLIQFSILMAKGFSSHNDWWPNLIDRDIINSMESIWNEETELLDAMKPVMDSLANCFGQARSSLIYQKEQECSKGK